MPHLVDRTAAHPPRSIYTASQKNADGVIRITLPSRLLAVFFEILSQQEIAKTPVTFPTES